MKIAIASAKGGVTKTTTSIYLAYCAAQRGYSSQVIDLDGQGSATRWSYSLEDTDEALPFPVRSANRHELPRIDDGDSVILIDTPPSQPDMTELACNNADLVIVVTPPALDDMGQAGVICQAMADADKSFFALITRAKKGTKALKNGRDALEDAGFPVCDVVIPERVAYQDSQAITKQKLEPYTQVWEQIEQICEDILPSQQGEKP